MRYLVMKVKYSYAVVLDEKGRFLNVINKGYSIGETIENVIIIEDLPKKSNNLIYAFGTIAACFLIFLSSIFYYQNYITYGVLYVSINPEIKAYVSKNGNLVKTEGINEEGIEILKNLTFKKRNLYDFLNKSFDSAIYKNYLKDSSEIIITIDSKNDSWFYDISVNIREKVQEDLAMKTKANFKILKLDGEYKTKDDLSPTQNSIETIKPKEIAPTQNNIETVRPEDTKSITPTTKEEKTFETKSQITDKQTENSVKTEQITSPTINETPKPIITNTPAPTIKNTSQPSQNNDRNNDDDDDDNDNDDNDNDDD